MLGRYGFDPIYDYPNSFYINLGLGTEFVGREIVFKKNLPHINFEIPKSYIYFNLQTSLGDIANPCVNDEGVKIVVFINANEIAIGQSLDKLTHYLISEAESLSLNLWLALNSKEIHVSDAGFFNILMHIQRKPNIFVYTRHHNHSHNKSLYPIKFDGAIQIIEGEI